MRAKHPIFIMFAIIPENTNLTFVIRCGKYYTSSEMKKHTIADDCSPLILAVNRGETDLVAFGRGQYPGVPIPQGQLPGLRSIGYWDAVGPQSWGLPMHRNEGIEICYLLSGETYFSTHSDKWMLHAGDITITRPWQRHQLGNPSIGPCKLFWMILDVESSEGREAWEFPSWIGPDSLSRRELLGIFRKNQRCHILDEGQQLKGFMEMICRNLGRDGSLKMAQVANWINFLLIEVAQQLSGEIKESAGDPLGFNQTIRQFFNGLESSVDKSAEPWTVAEIARACRVGKTYLSNACRDIFNTTPFEQLNRIRLAHAANLLKKFPEKSVTEIAFTSGFNTSQYFATRFRKQYGVSPQVFRG